LFSALVSRAEQGEEVTLLRRGKPVARLSPAAGGGDGPGFRVDWDLLEATAGGKKVRPAEEIVRQDRDARGW